MFSNLFNKNYLFYGGSIIVSRGLEYFVIFFAAHHLSKSDYGELEYYKKFIEVVSSVIAFGFPALILSYTKSSKSKIYFYLLSVLFVSGISLISLIFTFFFDEWIKILPALIFFSLFFTGGIVQSYQLVQNGSNYASVYKIVISVLFYFVVFVLIYFFNVKEMGYVYPAFILLPVAFIYAFFEFSKWKIQKREFIRYWQLFRKLLINSFTLVISNFANLLFLYTDIFVIKLVSDSPNNEIADFSFALSIASILLIVSTTLVQVEIEKLKSNSKFIFQLNKRILALSLLTTTFLSISYYIIINHFYLEYKFTLILFLVIMGGKIFLALSNLFGTNLVILKKFKLNLNINLIFLFLNLVGCYIGYKTFGLIGLATSSSLLLALRFWTLYHFNIKLIGK